MNWRPRIPYLRLFGLPLFLMFSLGITKAQSKPLSFTSKNGQQVIVYSESHALIIWAGDYQHPKWNRLTNVKSEAEDVSAALVRQGFTITTVSNPTGRQLREKIQDFINNYGYAKNNRLVIYFAGHGFSRNNSKGYLVPVDAPVPASDAQAEQAFLKVALDMDQIVSWAKQIEAKHVLFVFDSCFSGTIFKQRSASTIPLYIESIMSKPVRQFITAGDADQEVPAKSFFSPLFIRGIEGEADLSNDGYVTGSELGLYLKQNLGSYTTLQTPQFGAIRDPQLDQGDIIFHSFKKHQAARILSAYMDKPESKPQSTPQPSPSFVQPITAPHSVGKNNRLISKASGIDYTKLQGLLFGGKWKRADQETTEVMLAAAKAMWPNVKAEQIESFPCEDLHIINRLWSAASEGKFGFSIQKEIYERLGGLYEYNKETWNRLADRVGWRNNNNTLPWIGYPNLSFNVIKAPVGHLPVFGLAIFKQDDNVAGEYLSPNEDYGPLTLELYARIKSCRI